MTPDGSIPTTPIGFLNVAESYRVAGQVLAQAPKNPVGGFAGHPIRYCFYHAIELYLKGVLVAEGLTDSQLRRIGHRFTDLASECNRRGYGLIEADDAKVLELIDLSYMRARYHQTGFFSVATVQALDLTAHEAASLTVEHLRRKGLRVRGALPRLPLEHRYQNN